MSKTRAVAYARFSCDKQRDASIDDQIKACHEYADANGLEIIDHYCDYAISGRFDDRPQFLRMVEDAKMQTFDVIVMWKIDRFARNVTDQFYYEKILGEYGIHIESCCENITGQGIEATSNKVLLALFAQIRSQQSAVDSLRGMVGKAQKCQYLGDQVFGYSHEGDTITIDPLKAPIVAEIHDRFLAGQGVPVIVDWLHSIGIKGARGADVTRNFVYNVLKNQRYCGRYIWGKQRDLNGDPILDEYGHPVPLVDVEDGVPAIVSKEVKDEVLDRLGFKKRPEPEIDYLLSGKLYCGKCKQRMRGMMSRNQKGHGYRYYICAKKRSCCLGSCRQDVIEGLIADSIRMIMADKDLCRQIAEQYVEWQSLHKTEAVTKALKAEKYDLVRKRENLIDAVAGGMPWKDAKPRIDALDMQIDSVARRIEKASYEAGDFTESDIMEFFDDLTHKRTASDADIIRYFVSRVWLYKDKIAVTMSFSGKGVDTYEMDLAMQDDGPSGESVRTSFLWCPSQNSVRNKSVDDSVLVILLKEGFGLVIHR